jgi:CO/xanthine dehydrogenase FAD-binding subunit
VFRKLEYTAPYTLDEILSFLSDHPDARVLAGGTDLLVKLRDDMPRGTILVDLKRCSGQLRGVAERKDGSVWIGALTTVREIQESGILRKRYPAVTDAADLFGCLELRYRATIGGNVAHASPGAEFGTPLFVFDARVEIRGPAGSRSMPVAEFWRDVGTTALETGEIITGFVLPALPGKWRSQYRRISRTRGMDLAAMGVTLAVGEPARPERRSVRLALGAVARTPLRMHTVEEALSGKEITPALTERVRQMMTEELSPRATSLRAGPEYKKAMAGTLTERILRDFGLYGNADGNGNGKGSAS